MSGTAGACVRADDALTMAPPAAGPAALPASASPAKARRRRRPQVDRRVRASDGVSTVSIAAIPCVFSSSTQPGGSRRERAMAALASGKSCPTAQCDWGQPSAAPGSADTPTLQGVDEMSIESTQSCPLPSSTTNSGRGCWDYPGGISRDEVEFIVDILTGSVQIRCSAAFNAHERYENRLQAAAGVPCLIRNTGDAIRIAAPALTPTPLPPRGRGLYPLAHHNGRRGQGAREKHRDAEAISRKPYHAKTTPQKALLHKAPNQQGSSMPASAPTPLHVLRSDSN